MPEHVSDLLPFLVNDTLVGRERAVVLSHLATCESCRKELREWSEIAHAMAPSEAGALVPRAAKVHTLRRAAALLGAQWRLLPWRWLAPIGVLAAVLAASGVQTRGAAVPAALGWFLGPFLAAGAAAALAAPEAAAGEEVFIAAPTSPRTVLLARVTLAFGLFALLFGAAALIAAPRQALDLFLLWLAPMTALSGVGLLVAVWMGPVYGQTAAAVAWMLVLLEHLAGGGYLHGFVLLRGLGGLLAAPWGFAIAAVALAIALWQNGRPPLHATA